MLQAFLKTLLPNHQVEDDRPRSPPRHLLLSDPPTSSPTSKEIPPPPTPSQPLPPYLTRRHHLFLAVLSPSVLALLLALFTLVLLATQAIGSVDSAKREIMAGCRAAEKASATLDYLPSLMKEQSERAYKKMVEMGVKGVGMVLMLAIIVIQEVLKFLVDTFRSVYMCCLELVIFGALAILIGAIDEIGKAVKATLNGIRSLIRSEVSAANSVVQSAVSGINKITSVFGISAMSIDKFDIPALSRLENVTITSSLEGELIKLNNSLPTLNEVRAKLDSFIDEPFDAMSDMINSTTSNFTFTPSSSSSNATAALLASSSTLNDSLCSDLDLSFVDEVAHDLAKIKAWGIGLLVIIILIAIAVLLWLETRRYSSLLERIRFYRSVQAEKEGYNERDVMELVELSQMSIVGVWMWRGLEGWKRLGKGNTRRGKWLVALIFHPLALAPLFLGAIGLITIWFQLAAVTAIENKANSLSASSIDDMTNSMTAALNNRLALTGQEWATDLNEDIARTQKMLDDQLFGEWVNTTTVVLNTTLVDFYSMVTEAVNATFGSTILEAPINTFLYCMIGSKVAAMETALTWIHDHAHFTLPVVPDDVFALSNDTMAALVSPIAAAAVGTNDGDGNDKDGVLQRLIEHYKKGLRTAQIVHAIFVGLWVAVLIGGIVTVVCDAQREKREREGLEPVDFKAVVGAWPVFKVLGRQRRRRRTADNGAEEDLPAITEKIASFRDAFPVPHRDLPTTPLSPSHHHLTAPRPLTHPAAASYAPADRENSYFEFDKGVQRSSPYPWPLRATSLQPEARHAPEEAGTGWKSKLKERMAALAAQLNPQTSSPVALTDDDDDDGRQGTSRRFTAQPLNPFSDAASASNTNLPIARAFISGNTSSLPPPPAEYTANVSPYHAIGSPSDRYTHANAPIYAQHRRTENPFAHDDDMRVADYQALGKDPWASPFDNPRP